MSLTNSPRTDKTISAGSENVLSDYLERETLARQLKKSVRTLERWEQLRIGPPITRLGKDPYYRISSVRAWLQSREKSPRKR